MKNQDECKSHYIYTYLKTLKYILKIVLNFWY